MREQLIARIAEQVNLDPAVAAKAVDAVIGFLKENPEKVTELLGNEIVGDLGGKLGKMFGR